MGCKPIDRKSDLARIHILKGELDMADEDYRATLWAVAQVHSAADLDWRGRRLVIDHLADLKRRQGARERYPGRPPATDDNPQLRKIEALLADQHLPWRYANGIAKRMFGKERVAFCSSQELSAVITALTRRAEKNAQAS